MLGQASSIASVDVDHASQAGLIGTSKIVSECTTNPEPFQGVTRVRLSSMPTRPRLDRNPSTSLMKVIRAMK
jgi:hypothetical protein